MLRPVRPLSLPGITPGAAAANPVPEYRMVDPAALLIDDGYQRGLSERSMRLIRRIISGWDWSSFKPPIVSDVDGALHVIDGQHTAIAAASHPGIAAIPVQIVVAAEIADRATAFVRHNRDRISVTPTQLHVALVAAGDEDALTVTQVCERAGVRILKNPPPSGMFRVGDTLAVGAIRALVNRRHAAGARKVLDICVAGRAQPVSMMLIRAVETLVFEPEYQGEMTGERIAEVIRAMGP